MLNELRKLRPWFRFRVRTLLILVTLVCLWLGWTAHVARQRSAAFAAIEQSRGWLEIDEAAKAQRSRPAGWFGRLWGDAYVERARTVGLGALEEVSDEIMPHLAALPELQVLDLRNDQISDEGLAYLRNLHRLRYLSLVETPITDTGIKYICRLPKLRYLDLGATKLTHAAAVDLTNLPKIEQLILSWTEMTDKSAECLSRVSTLRKVSLNGTRISDVALEFLERLPNLEYLDVSFTDVSYEAMARFKAHKPNCTLEGYCPLFNPRQ